MRNVTQEWARAIRDAESVTRTDLAIALVLATYADYRTGENVKPKMRNVARQVGISPSNLSRGVGRLLEGGWLARVGTKWGNHKVFRLALPGDWVDREEPPY